MSEREHYIWHIELRDDNNYYAVHQFGGWLKCRTRERAEESIKRSVERYGDEWKQVEA